MVYVFLADGFEEMEAIAPIDLLRRSGAEVKTVGVGSKMVKGAHQIPVECDITDQEILLDGLEMVILPGGMPGTTNLDKSEAVARCLAWAAEHNVWIGAICAAPSVLGHKGILQGKKATCFPGFEQELSGAVFTGQPVEQDGKVITAKGAGVAVDFGLRLAAALKGKAAAMELKDAIQCQK